MDERELNMNSAKPTKSCTKISWILSIIKQFKPIIAALLVITAAIPNASASNSEKRFRLNYVNEPRTPPKFTLPDHLGALHSLSEFEGRVVVVNFWSTWCIPCRQEMPALERAWKRLEPNGVVLLGIAMQDELEMVNLFLKKVQVTFPVLMDNDGSVSAQWRVNGIPATYILDSTGRMIYEASGIREWDSDPVIEKILELIEKPENKAN